MIVHRCATAVATLVVALAVALAVPVSQLTTVSVVTTCCCPDPANCHCPDHQPDRGKQASLRACHQQREVTAAPQLPSFTAPALAIAQPTTHLVAPPVLAMTEPHAPPAAKRPDAPS